MAGLQSAERFNREMARREAGNFYWGFISLPLSTSAWRSTRSITSHAYSTTKRDSGGAENLPSGRWCIATASSRRVAAMPDDDPIMQILARSHAALFDSGARVGRC